MSGQDEPNPPLWLVTWVGKMNQIVHCDWSPEWARWTKSSTVIGYPSGQDDSILLTQDYPLGPTRKIFLKAIFKQILYWPSLFGQDGY